jgi:hypothetical protein
LIGKALRVVGAVLAMQALVLSTAQAQDFDSLVNQAVAANRQLVDHISAATQAADLATLHADITLGVGSAKAAQALLQQALAVAPNDAARSRAQGVLTHITASLDSATQASRATTLDVARSQVDAARGEAVEALNELVPFAAPPATLPVTGGPPVGLLAGVGLVALTLGLGLRRARFTSPFERAGA